MTLEKVHKDTQKRQRALMRQITTRQMKIATLHAEIDALRDDLAEAATDIATAWATRGQHLPRDVETCPECHAVAPDWTEDSIPDPLTGAEYFYSTYGCCGAQVFEDDE